MTIPRLIGALAFALTLFASTANEEVDDVIQSLGHSHVRAKLIPTYPFLCDSLAADDCFMMLASKLGAPENITTIAPTRRASSSTVRFEPVGCSFSPGFRGDRCRMIGPAR